MLPPTPGIEFNTDVFGEVICGECGVQSHCFCEECDEYVPTSHCSVEDSVLDVDGMEIEESKVICNVCDENSDEDNWEDNTCGWYENEKKYGVQKFTKPSTDPRGEEKPKTYKIIRFFQDSEKPNKVILTGLTLEQAQNHCSDPDTSGDGWFDGYDEWDEIGDLKRNIENVVNDIRNSVLCWRWEDRNKYNCNVFNEIVEECDAGIEKLKTLIKEIK